MTTEQLLWGGLAILAVFILNQVLGRLLAEYLGDRRKGAPDAPSRQEHDMCLRHTQTAICSLEATIKEMRRENEAGHREIHGRLDVVIDKINNMNGVRP